MGVDIGNILSTLNSILPNRVVTFVDSVKFQIKELMIPKASEKDILLIFSELNGKRAGKPYFFYGTQTRFDIQKCNGDNLVIFLNEAGLAIGIYIENEHIAKFLKTKTNLPIYTSTEKIDSRFIVTQKFGKSPLSNEQVDGIIGQIDTFFEYNRGVLSSQSYILLGIDDIEVFIENVKDFYYRNLKVPGSTEEVLHLYKSPFVPRPSLLRV